MKIIRYPHPQEIVRRISFCRKDGDRYFRRACLNVDKYIVCSRLKVNYELENMEGKDGHEKEAKEKVLGDTTI